MVIAPRICRDRVRCALAAWHDPDGPSASATCPTDQLIADHVVMDAALEAIGREARELREGLELRPDFWSCAVDFIGNYVRRVHRAKEEKLFRALTCWGLVAPGAAEPLVEEHRRAWQLTVDLGDAVSEGDWERVLRVVSMYLHFMQPHMRREESEWLEPLARRLDEDHQRALGAAFREIDARELPGGRRTEIAELVRRLTRNTGVADPFDALSDESHPPS